MNVDAATRIRQLAEQAVDSMLAARPPCGCGDDTPVGVEAALDEYDAEYDVIVAAGGMPGNLTAYWARGEGAAKIRWGTNGAFDRCVGLLGEYVKDPKGTCANLEKNATGDWPAEKKIQSAMMDRWIEAAENDSDVAAQLRQLLGDTP